VEHRRLIQPAQLPQKGIEAQVGSKINWPEDPGSVDLGARVLDVLAVPGHD